MSAESDPIFNECAEIFGLAAAELMRRQTSEAPPFSPEMRLRGRRLFASFGVQRARPPGDAADAADPHMRPALSGD